MKKQVVNKGGDSFYFRGHHFERRPVEHQSYQLYERRPVEHPSYQLYRDNDWLGEICRNPNSIKWEVYCGDRDTLTIPSEHKEDAAMLLLTTLKLPMAIEDLTPKQEQDVWGLFRL